MQKSCDIVFLYVPGQKSNLKKISHMLLQRKLCLCVNIVELDCSLHLSADNKVQQQKEYVGIFKVLLKNTQHYKEVITLIEREHSYDTCSIFEMPITTLNLKSMKFYQENKDL
jgi:uncharacterized protein involved in tolerance to divalent cations